MVFSFDRDPGKNDSRKPSGDDVNWPVFTTDSEKYLVIDLADPRRVESKLEVDRVVFWEDFLPILAKGIRKDEL